MAGQVAELARGSTGGLPVKRGCSGNRMLCGAGAGGQSSYEEQVMLVQSPSQTMLELQERR